MIAGKGYPKGLLSVPTVSMDCWISQQEAARILKFSTWRIGLLISVDHLSPVHNPAGEAGVTKASLFEEINWRKSATILQKLRRILKDCIKFI